jgi:hypothetical protein
LCRHKHHNKSVVGSDRNDALAKKRKNDFLQPKKNLQFFLLKFKKKSLEHQTHRHTDVVVKKQKKESSKMLMKRTTLYPPATNWRSREEEVNSIAAFFFSLCLKYPVSTRKDG